MSPNALMGAPPNTAPAPNMGAGGPQINPPFLGTPAPQAPNLPELASPPEYDYAIDLSDADRDELGLAIQRKIRDSVQRRGAFDDQVREWRDQYESVSYPKDWPWPGAANLNIPTTRSAVDTLHARTYAAMVGSTPLFRAEAESRVDEDVLQRIQGVLNWQLEDQADFRLFLDWALQRCYVDGTSIGLVAWDRRVDTVREPRVTTLPNGTTRAELVERQDVVRNRPVLERVDILDFVMYPANAASLEKAIGLGRRVWKTKNDLLSDVRNEILEQKHVDALLDRSPAQPLVNNEGNGGDEPRLAAIQLENADPIDNDDRPFEFFEVIWQYDADGDGIAEDCWFLIEMSTGYLVKAEKYPFWHNQRCFVAYVPYPRPKALYGYSIPEIVYDLHHERNAIRNQRVDAGTLALMPMFLKRRSVRLDLTKSPLYPGVTIDCDNPESDIRPFSIPNLTQSAFAEEQRAEEMIEMVTGANAYSQGQSPSKSRTLGEVDQVTVAGNVRLDLIIARLGATNNAIANLVIGLDRQFLDAKTEYAITQEGGRAFQEIEPGAFALRVRLVAQGNTVNSNKQLELQASETLFQMMMNEPLIQSDITRRYAVLARYLQAAGTTNVAPYIGTLKQAEDMQQQQENSPPPPPAPPNLAGKLDEVMTLALLMKEGVLNHDDYEQAYMLLRVAGTLPNNTVAGQNPEGHVDPTPPAAGFPQNGGNAGPQPGASMNPQTAPPPIGAGGPLG